MDDQISLFVFSDVNNSLIRGILIFDLSISFSKIEKCKKFHVKRNKFSLMPNFHEKVINLENKLLLNKDINIIEELINIYSKFELIRRTRN